MPAQPNAAAAARALAAKADEDMNAASYASYAPPSNFLGRVWQVDSARPSTSIIDLKSTGNGDGLVADSFEDE